MAKPARAQNVRSGYARSQRHAAHSRKAHAVGWVDALHTARTAKRKKKKKKKKKKC